MSGPEAPRFTVLTPVYETPPQLLIECIDSVVHQTYADWELLLVDDGSTDPAVHRLLDEAVLRDPRIRVHRRAENGGIIAASNDGLGIARGEFIAGLDHDDTLHLTALAKVAEAIDRAGADLVDYVYTDQDKIDEDGTHHGPFYKPDWSPDRFRAQMYTNHLGVFRRSLVTEVGGFREGFEGSQDYDLVFRLTERARLVVHVPEILYHWRVTEQSVTANVDAKPYAWINGARAIQAHCDRTGFEATVEHDMIWPGVYKLTPNLREQPLVSIVIPTGGSFREVYGERVLLAEYCIQHLVATSTYENYEIIAVIDDHVPDDIRRRIEAAGGDRLQTIIYKKPFNFADKCNLGAILSNGEHILFLNDDTEVIAPDWLESLVMYSKTPGIGAVGGRLLYGDGRIQHVGVHVLGEVAAGHIYRGYPGSDLGYYGITRLPCNYLAVTGACLMSPRHVFEEVGGMTIDFPINYNDVDYCFKVHEAGYRVVFDPNAELYHHESSSREPVLREWETELIQERWAVFERDPYLNPNFDHDSVSYICPVYDTNGEAFKRPVTPKKRKLRSRLP
jgi:GT2 family glycosyltransferase